MATPRSRPLAVVVLAAGQGKRFRSATPKVLHELVGRSMLGWVLDASKPLKAKQTVVVVGVGADEVRAAFPTGVRFATQRGQLGTAHALKAGMKELGSFRGDVLVLSGDSPLLRPETLRALAAKHRRTRAAATILTFEVDGSTDLGRVIRDDVGRVARIVEHRDATATERAVNEVNAGIYVFDATAITAALKRVKRNNKQREEYLPDAVGVLIASGARVDAAVGDADTLLGVNDRAQLATAAALLRRRILEEHARAGVTFLDPDATYVEPGVKVAPDAVIWPHTFLSGSTRIDRGAIVGPSVQLNDTRVGAGSKVRFTVANGARIGADCEVGPFAYLRPGTILKAHSKIGTFVEAKNITLGERSKVPHLSYVGDATIGRDVNVGAATIIVNYDSETKIKARTKIGDGAKIGSDTMLIAPVTVGRNAATGAGSVVTRDIPPGILVVGNPARPLRKSKLGATKRGATKQGATRRGGTRSR